MRPIERGAAPRAYARYQEAGPDLRARLGDYCSYCERQIETNLAVEHVRPKSHEPGLRTSWPNFLLACANCNSSKGDTPIDLPDYFWPDSDNTLRAFEYMRGGVIRPHPALDAVLQAKARSSIRLVGLDRVPGNAAAEPTSADQRWARRQEAWQLAKNSKATLARHDTPEIRDLIVNVATGRGEFSIWWTAFAGDADMRRRLREAFAGTHSGSFDANEECVPRAGGQL